MGESLWAPALVFICSPSVAMAAILLVHNGWMALCINLFTKVVLRSDLNELLKVGEFGDMQIVIVCLSVHMGKLSGIQ